MLSYTASVSNRARKSTVSSSLNGSAEAQSDTNYDAQHLYNCSHAEYALPCTVCLFPRSSTHLSSINELLRVVAGRYMWHVVPVTLDNSEPRVANNDAREGERNYFTTLASA